MYKIIILIISVIILSSCGTKHSDEYVSISGLIAHNDASEILLLARNYKKTIPIKLDGTFSDTLKLVKNGYFTLSDGKHRAMMFLKNGDEIKINFDYTSFNNSLSFSGKGSEINQYIIDRKLFETKERPNDLRRLSKLDESAFNDKMTFFETEYKKMLSNVNIDSAYKANETSRIKRGLNKTKRGYMSERLRITKLAVGMPSPKFVNFENEKGGTTSLDDFKGKYVYIDVWATWCRPCIGEIPSMKKIEHAFKGKKIAFVSISVDNGRGYKGNSKEATKEAAKLGWHKMVKEKDMGGVQLFADNAWQSDFIKSYGITGIPRFILLDPNGNIVNSNAPRPSSRNLSILLSELPL
jgi:thiol-disulfide isomerase/thioredoxin